MKNKSTAILLCFFLGGFGAHHFYLGRMLAGFLSLLFFWTVIPAIIAFINLVQLILTDEEEFNKKYNS